MRILYLTSHWPCGPASGSQLRAYHTAAALRGLGSVDMITVGAEEQARSGAEATAREFNVIGSLGVEEFRRLGRGGGQRAVSGGRGRVFDARMPYPHGIAVREPDQKRVEDLISDYDLIWFFKLRTANFFARWQWPRSVVDIDDVPSTYELAERANSSGLRKLKATWRAWVWARRERLLSERFNALCVCSDADKEHLRATVPVYVIPNGFSAPSPHPTAHHPRPTAHSLQAPAPRIGFIGLFEHVPNSDGVEWFARECWPRIKAQVPDCRLRLIGKGSDTHLAPAGPDIDQLGWVADVQEEIETWSAMIVPIRLGAGTRVKIPDAFSRKCPVVSTTLGAYGYEVEHGREIMLADTVDAFAEACVKLIRAPAEATEMAERAYKAFLEKWTWDAITPRIHAAAQAACRHRTAASVTS